jgi:hypothetical protein
LEEPTASIFEVEQQTEESKLWYGYREREDWNRNSEQTNRSKENTVECDWLIRRSSPNVEQLGEITDG